MLPSVTANLTHDYLRSATFKARHFGKPNELWLGWLGRAERDVRVHTGVCQWQMPLAALCGAWRERDMLNEISPQDKQ